MTREEFIHHVTESHGALRRFLAALCCGDTMKADDLAQETLVKAYMALDSIASPRAFKAWLYKIAYNTFINSTRSWHPEVTIENALHVQAHEETDAAFSHEALHRALNTLSERERAAIVLHYLEGYDIKEIASMTGSSVDAVKQQLSRGRDHLRYQLNYGTRP